MNLSKLPKEVLINYIEQYTFGVDEKQLKLLHQNYKHQLLIKEFDRLVEEGDKVKGDIHAWLNVQKCIDAVFDDMAKLSA